MTMFFSSTYPSSCKPWRKASMRAVLAEGEAALRNPIRGTFAGCCASTGKLRANTMMLRANVKMSFFITLLNPFTSRLSDHLIRPVQHRLRNCETDLFRCFEIDHELELRRLFDREISGLGTSQDLVDISSGAAVKIGKARSISHETPSEYIVLLGIHCWKTIFCRKVYDPRLVRRKKSA